MCLIFKKKNIYILLYILLYYFFYYRFVHIVVSNQLVSIYCVAHNVRCYFYLLLCHYYLSLDLFHILNSYFDTQHLPCVRCCNQVYFYNCKCRAFQYRTQFECVQLIYKFLTFNEYCCTPFAMQCNAQCTRCAMAHLFFYRFCFCSKSSNLFAS